MKNLFFLLMLLFAYIQPSNAQIADPVKWQTEYKLVAGNNAELIIKASIDKGYHMYGMYFGEGGPIPTSFKFADNKNFALIGKMVELTKPKSKKDPSFDNMEITLHNGKAVFVQKIELKTKNPIAVKGVVEYMACTDESCLPPVEKELVFTIVPSSQNIDEKSNSTPDSITISSVDSLKHDSVTTADISAKLETNLTGNSDNSLWGFFLLALLAGLAGTITPCVFPMIPMTVSFFMRGTQSRSHGIIKGLVFGLSIMLVYTLVGVLVSFTSIGSDFANQLSTHWIPNLVFFILFFVFSLSFLGLFEMVLPSGIITKADRQADKGGYLGIIFMALATVLVSFSCTGPIVGALLVEAAGAVALKPILGMFGFGLAFALPFTFFAIFPSSLNKLPKSGGWLNEVKVVLGLVMIAFGLKFLVNIDQTYHFDIISRDIFLVIWIVLSVILGLYLLGKIRMVHDSEVHKIGVFRLLLVILSFIFALYLTTGLFSNNALKSVSSFLPPQKEKLSLQILPQLNNQANICETPKYAELFHFSYGLKGYFEYNQALECAKKINKPVLVDFKGHACSNCKRMEAEVWSNLEVQKKISENFVLVGLYTDDRTQLREDEIVVSKLDGKTKKTIGQLNADLEATLFKSNALPLYVIVDPDGKLLISPIGTELDVNKYLTFLEEGIRIFADVNK